MRFERSSGQITVFLTIILLAVLLLTGALVDASRISSGEAIVKNAVRSSARSALANYGSKLKEDYGVFALSKSSEDQLDETVTSYMEKNLIHGADGTGDSKALDLYGFRIESVNVTPVFNLSENNVFRQQILEYMKYRAPKEIIKGFIDKLSAVKETGKMSEAYNKKVSIDKLLGNMDKSQQKLKKAVDGSGSANEKYINGFNSGGSWVKAYNSFNAQCENIRSLKQRLDALDESCAELQSAINNKKNNNVEDTTAARFRELLTERASAASSLYNSINSLQATWSEIRFALSGDYLAPNNNAINEINSIITIGKKAESTMSELEDFINGNFNDLDLFSKDFKTTTREELKKFRDMTLSGQKAAELLGNLSSNKIFLNDLTGKLDSAWRDMGGGVVSNPSGLPGDLLEFVKSYSSVSYDYVKPPKGNKKDDPRNGKAEEAQETLLDKLLNDIDYRNEGILEEDLPSKTKLESVSFGKTADYGGDLSNVGNNIDLFDEEDTFQQNALGFISDIGKAATDDISKLRDDIYIDEYIMGTFKNSVPMLNESTISSESSVLQNETAAKNDTDLSGVEKLQRDTFYQSETEYILHGNPSENINKLMTKGQILLVRFGLDTLHVYTDPQKKEEAVVIATAVSGWWTGGAGIPIISNLIMCGWGMGEAIIDVKDLMGGKSVPIYKSKGDWKLDIGIAKGGKKTDARLCFSYYDYLRLFLLVMDENKKLGRMEDLIQLNIQKNNSDFKMTQCNTYVRVEAVVSMKYMFMTQPFVPAQMKTGDGRRKFKVLIYEGY